MSSVHAHLVDAAREVGGVLADVLEDHGHVPLRRRRDGPLPEFLARAVAGQQLSVKAASTIWGRVVASADGRDLVEHVLASDDALLRGCGLSGAKTAALRAIAAAAVAGELDEDELAALDTDARRERLVAIRGVGPWTADMLAIFRFGDRDVWPDGDVTARKTLARLTSPRRKTVRTAERFAPYRSYLALHMWHAADAKPT